MRDYELGYSTGLIDGFALGLVLSLLLLLGHILYAS